MNPEINSWTFIFLFAAAQGLFLAVMILKLKKGSKHANQLLALLIMLFSVSLIYYVAYWTGLDNKLPRIFKLVLNFVWLFGPLHYLYILALDGKSFNKKQLWHLAPFVSITIIQYLAYNLFRNDNSISDGITPQHFSIAVIATQLIQLAFYIYFIAKYLDKRQPGIASNSGLKWPKHLLYFYIGFCLSYFSYYLLVWTNNLAIEHDYAISLLMSIFIYMVGYYGFIKPEILVGGGQVNKYVKSSLSESASAALMEKLLTHMATAKPYANSELKLGQLASQIDITPHHLSQLINESRKQNFSDFINYYRINHAKMLINQQINREEKLINIAYDSGFNNKVSFNSAFKKFTGYSPSQYRNQISMGKKYPQKEK